MGTRIVVELKRVKLMIQELRSSVSIVRNVQLKDSTKRVELDLWSLTEEAAMWQKTEKSESAKRKGGIVQFPQDFRFW